MEFRKDCHLRWFVYNILICLFNFPRIWNDKNSELERLIEILGAFSDLEWQMIFFNGMSPYVAINSIITIVNQNICIGHIFLRIKWNFTFFLRINTGMNIWCLYSDSFGWTITIKNWTIAFKVIDTTTTVSTYCTYFIIHTGWTRTTFLATFWPAIVVNWKPFQLTLIFLWKLL